MATAPTGLVADIQRASLHDGPGLRTTVFLKGCGLRCAWCHNPETLKAEPEMLFYADKCIGCGGCDDGCFAGAKVPCGVEMTVEAVLAEAAQDAPYYGKEGGITLSGGEPLLQPAFAAALLAAARKKGYHTAIESSLHAPAKNLEQVLEHTDLLMADLKLWDAEEHRRWTGAGNRLILENLKAADAAGVPIILRTPVVPTATDGEDNITAIAGFAARLQNLLYYELLPYHPLGTGKAAALGRAEDSFELPPPPQMAKLAALAAQSGAAVRVGGVDHREYISRQTSGASHDEN